MIDETINNMISECNKLAQNTRHDWEGKVIHLELCKKFKFGHTNKCYMSNPESVLENNTYIQTLPDRLILTTRPYDNQQQKTCKIVDFAVPVDHRVKLKESEKKDKYSTLLGNWKTVDYESDVYTNHN